MGEQGRGSDAIRSAAATLRVGMPLERNRPACTRPLRRPRCPMILRQAQDERVKGVSEQRTGLGLASPCPGPATSRKESARRITYMVRSVKTSLEQRAFISHHPFPFPKGERIRRLGGWPPRRSWSGGSALESEDPPHPATLGPVRAKLRYLSPTGRGEMRLRIRARCSK